MEFYDVPAYWEDQRLIEIHRDDRCREIRANIETCMEELAMSFGLDWQRIGGLMVDEVGMGGSRQGQQHQFTQYQQGYQQQQGQQQYSGPVRRETMYSD